MRDVKQKQVAASALVSILLLAGCTPAMKGAMGVTRTNSGDVVAVLARCGSSVDTLWVSQENQETSDLIAELPMSDLTSNQVEIPVSSLTPGAGGAGTVSFQPGKEYSFRGVSTDNESNSDGVTFTLQTLQDLEPGAVLFTAPDGTLARIDKGHFASVHCRGEN